MNKEFINGFMVRQEFPTDSITEFNRVMDIINGNDYFNGYFDACMETFWLDPNCETRFFIGCSDNLSKKTGIHTYTLQMMFLLACLPELYKRYNEKGIDEQIFYDTMLDLRAKLIECKDCKYVWGSFVTDWFSRFYAMTRFALGRFQFEENDYDGNTITYGDYTLQKGDKVYGFHIPSHPIPLSDEVRIDSYKKAYEFYHAKNGINSPIFLCCGSWLLFKPYYDILPAKSNIRKFQDDFDIKTVNYRDNFGDAWRVFNDKADLPVNDWPEDTSMRKALKNHFQNGGKAGSGWGVILFDGEKIISK